MSSTSGVTMSCQQWSSKSSVMEPSLSDGRAASLIGPGRAVNGADLIRLQPILIGKLQPLLEELDLVPVGIGDVDGQAIDAIVQLVEELDLCGLEALRDGAHTRDAERHVIDLQRLARVASGQRDALRERNDGAAIGQRDRPPRGEAEQVQIEVP